LNDPRVQLIGALLVTTLLFVYIVRRLISHFVRRTASAASAESHGVWIQLIHAALGPLSLLVWYYGLYAIARVAINGYWLPPGWDWVENALRQVAVIGVVAAVLWFFYRAARVLDEHLKSIAARTASRIDDVLLPLLGTGLRLVVPILALLLVVRLWPLSDVALEFVQKLLAIALIGAVTLILRQSILLAEAAIIRREDAASGRDLATRALITRVSVLRKIALVLITLFAVAATLMLFPQVRQIGQSILASAGIAGIVLGFAAQKTLGNLLAGIQIALTQPVRIGDLVLIETELGTIEEITLTYVVVRIWDLRRLVLPISYLIEKPVQNWTRSSANLLSTVKLRVDFSLPVDEFRGHMRAVIEQSPHWDKQTFALQVTDADGGSMEIRILGSAATANNSFNLQCELREKAYDFLARRYPQFLPNFRPDRNPPDSAAPEPKR